MSLIGQTLSHYRITAAIGARRDGSVRFLVKVPAQQAP